jgi:Fe-S-cluster containining protein
MSFARVLESGFLERRVRQLWRDYQLRPVRGFRHFWRLWKLHREFDLTISPVNAQSWQWLFPQDRRPNCHSCLENCCKGIHNTVLLRLVDVALLLDRGLDEHITLEKPVFTGEMLAAKPRLQEMLRSFHWRVFPVLKQKSSDQTCTFLSPDGRCLIHAYRPWICRVFPYSLDVEQRSVSWSERCRCFDSADPQVSPIAELRQAVFHNFYTEKMLDLILVSVYREELEQIGLTSWLCLD